MDVDITSTPEMLVYGNNFSVSPFDEDLTNQSYPLTPTARQVNILSKIGVSLHKYGTPVIIIVGLLGNLCSLMVFVKTPLRRLSSSVYLAALAVTDTAFLVQLFFAWLGYMRVFLIHRPGVCHFAVYVSYVSSFLSVWFITSFTVERYIAVCYPLRRHDMCTVRRAKIVVFALTLFATIAYSFGAWTSGILNRTCTCLPEYMQLVKILNNVDTVITLIVPSFTIFVMNIRIMCKIAYFYEKQHMMMAESQLESKHHIRGDGQRMPLDLTCRHSLSSTQSSSAESPHHRQGSNLSFRNRNQIRITKLLLVVSTVFLVLNLPSHALRIYDFFVVMMNVETSYPKIVLDLQQFFTLLYYMNFSVNFFLYSLCGKNFRRALYRLGKQCIGYKCKMTCHCRCKRKTYNAGNVIPHPAMIGDHDRPVGSEPHRRVPNNFSIQPPISREWNKRQQNETEIALAPIMGVSERK